MFRFILPFFLTACATGVATQSSVESESVATAQNGCCTGFLAEPDTPIWYRDLDDSARDDAQILCDSGGGQWKSSPCSTAGIVGGCVYNDVPLPYIQLYPESVYGADDKKVAEVHCPAGEGMSWATEFK